MKINRLIFGLLALPLLAGAKPVELLSPGGKNRVVVETGPQVTYSVWHGEQQVLAGCPLTMTVGTQTWGAGEKAPKVRRQTVDETVTFTVARKYPQARNHYNLLTLSWQDHAIEFRAYDEGVAYRFVSLQDNPAPVMDEGIEFRFAADHRSYTLLTDKLQNWYEEDYTVERIGKLPRDKFSLIPVMVEAGDLKVMLSEADLYHYAGLYLAPGDRSFRGVMSKYPKTEGFEDGDNKIYPQTYQDYLIDRAGRRTFPWRVAGIYEKATDIIASELIFLLSEAEPAGADYSWIKPGKVLWDWWNDRNIYGVPFKAGINTATYLYLIDWAAKNGLEYILIDEGWSARNDLMQLNPEVDVKRICDHAKTKGVGVQLWCKWHNLDRQMTEAFDQFAAWGVAGVKIDFMDRNDAKMVDYYERVAVEAAKRRLLVDFHGSYPGEGMLRKYPNLMTREGLIGMEYDKWSNRATPKHDVIIPYLRMWAGPMDYTPGAMLNAHPETFLATQVEPMSQGTRSHQLAMYVVYESPLQMVSDSPTKYDANPGSYRFIRECPTVWERTVPLAGEIGEWVAVARLSEGKWYLGVLNGTSARTVTLDLSFAGNDSLKILSHADGPNAEKQAKDFTVAEKALPAGTKLTIEMARGGGYMAIIEPAGK